MARKTDAMGIGMGRSLEVRKDQTGTGSLRADMASLPPTVAKVITLGVQDKNGVRGPMGGVTGEGELIELRASEAGGRSNNWLVIILSGHNRHGHGLCPPCNS